MTQTPLSQMADTGYENMSEESGYVLHETKKMFVQFEKVLRGKVGTEDLTPILKALAEAPSRADIQQLVTSFSKEFATKAELVTILNSVTSGMLPLQSVTIEVSPAEILALNASPRGMIPAPGAGMYIELVRYELFYDYESVPYATVAGKTLSIEYSSGEQINSIDAQGTLDQSADVRKSTNHGTSDLVVNDGVVLKMLGGEVTAGDSPLKVRLDYRIRQALV